MSPPWRKGATPHPRRAASALGSISPAPILRVPEVESPSNPDVKDQHTNNLLKSTKSTPSTLNRESRISGNNQIDTRPRRSAQSPRSVQLAWMAALPLTDNSPAPRQALLTQPLGLALDAEGDNYVGSARHLPGRNTSAVVGGTPRQREVANNAITPEASLEPQVLTLDAQRGVRFQVLPPSGGEGTHRLVTADAAAVADAETVSNAVGDAVTLEGWRLQYDIGGRRSCAVSVDDVGGLAAAGFLAQTTNVWAAASNAAAEAATVGPALLQDVLQRVSWLPPSPLAGGVFVELAPGVPAPVAVSAQVC